METLKDWLGTFWRILTSPTPKTFIEEAEKAENKFASTVGWAVFLSFYAYLLPLLKGFTFDFTVLIAALLIFPIILVLVPSATHFMLQRVFHKKQYFYDKVMYLFAAILVLFQFIASPISYFVPTGMAPVATVINALLITYQLILFVIAIQAISRVNYWQAIITVLASLAAGTLIFVCTLPMIISVMGGVNRTMR